jgi:thiamine biosynthesis lipoprotein
MRARKHILRNSIHLFTEVKRLFFICMIGATVTCQAQKSYKRTLKLMGCRFDITVVAGNEATANKYLDTAIAEISRIEKLISSWCSTSQTSQINRNAGIRPVKVDAELFRLIERSIGISKLTDGAFDISYAVIDQLWKFDGSMTDLPSEQDVKASLQKVGYQNIVLDRAKGTVFLKLGGMKIGFGAIGKGYAADQAKSLLIALGVSSGIINASGDINVWGNHPDGTQWKVAITNPLDKSRSYGLLPISEGAVVTSGNYEKFVEFDGKRFTHIIDPRTGMPTSGIVSVTVFAPKAELADALATALFVMGETVGLNIINQMAKVESVIIDEYGRVFTSNNISIKKL